MAHIVSIRHIALSAQIVIPALGALPSYTLDTVRLAMITKNVRMLDSCRGVIEDQQVVGILIANAIVASGAMVPLYNDSPVRSLVGVISVGGSGSGSSGVPGTTGWLADLDNGARVTLAPILVGPLPVPASDDPQADL